MKSYIFIQSHSGVPLSKILFSLLCHEMHLAITSRFEAYSHRMRLTYPFVVIVSPRELL
jgi:hypothetical protein